MIDRRVQLVAYSTHTCIAKLAEIGDTTKKNDSNNAETSLLSFYDICILGG